MGTAGLFPDLAPAYHGRDGLRKFWRDFTGPWDEIVLEPLRFEVADDVAVVDMRFRARGRGGIEVDITLFNRFVRRDGLTSFVQVHPSREDALAAAGLQPSLGVSGLISTNLPTASHRPPIRWAK